MAIFDRAGAAVRVGRSERTIRDWERRGWMAFTLGRVRESDLLVAERTARENRRRGGRKAKGQSMESIDLADESAWPEGAVSDGRVYSLELSRMMRFDNDLGEAWFAGADVDPWVPCEPDIVDPPFDPEMMTGSYVDVAARAVHLNGKLTRNGVKAFIYYPSPVEPQDAR